MRAICGYAQGRSAVDDKDNACDPVVSFIITCRNKSLGEKKWNKHSMLMRREIEMAGSHLPYLS